MDWPDAARYFQSLVPAEVRCNPLYDDTLVYKCCMGHRHRPYMTFEEALDVIRQVHNVTGGMKQVCYFAYFQFEGGETGYPEMWSIYPPLGDKEMLRRVMDEARQYNAIVSFHQNLDVFDAHAALGGRGVRRPRHAGTHDRLLLASDAAPDDRHARLSRAVPQAYCQARERVRHQPDLPPGHLQRRTVRLRRQSRAPFCAYDFQQAKLEILKDFNEHGIDVTSENLTAPYVGRIGHVWALFNGGTFWKGEEAVPLGNFIYHGAASWNSGNARNTAAILESLILGGGASMEFPMGPFIPAEGRLDIIPTPWPQVLDNLYLVHPPYRMLRRASGPTSRATAASGAWSTRRTKAGRVSSRLTPTGPATRSSWTGE